MGHPKKQRKKYATPKKPYSRERIEKEKKLLQGYGLRRKREIWRAEAILRNFRQRARNLQAHHNENRFNELIKKMNTLGLRCETLDDVLEVQLEGILSRRLQTIIYKKGLANSFKHARQMIVHGNVYVDNRKVKWPSFLVPSRLEDRIDINAKIKATIIKKEIQKSKAEINQESKPEVKTEINPEVKTEEQPKEAVS